MKSEKWILLGASRGLGKAFADIATSKGIDVLNFSRKSNPWMDFSKAEMWKAYADQIFSEKPHRIFYFAGGGPFGEFQKKDWKDHQWSFNVTFAFPAFLLHQILVSKSAVQQVCVVGSNIAEDAPDQGAASYCAAKHALKGLVLTLQKENPNFDLRLFSPGYMDTEMLPPNAWPRQNAKVAKPLDVAADLFQWAQQPALQTERYRVFNP